MPWPDTLSSGPCSVFVPLHAAYFHTTCISGPSTYPVPTCQQLSLPPKPYPSRHPRSPHGLCNCPRKKLLLTPNLFPRFSTRCASAKPERISFGKLKILSSIASFTAQYKILEQLQLGKLNIFRHMCSTLQFPVAITTRKQQLVLPRVLHSTVCRGRQRLANQSRRTLRVCQTKNDFLGHMYPTPSQSGSADAQRPPSLVGQGRGPYAHVCCVFAHALMHARTYHIHAPLVYKETRQVALWRASRAPNSCYMNCAL